MTTLKAMCPDCKGQIKVPLTRVAVDEYARKCGKCGQRWRMLVRPKGEPVDGMLIHEISFFRSQPTQYGLNGIAGLVQQTKARSTGTMVGVYRADQAGMDDDDGQNPWSTVCERHGFICSHPTLRLARDHAVDPTGWCDCCRAHDFDLDTGECVNCHETDDRSVGISHA